MSLMREVPVTMLFANGRTSWFVFEADGIKRVDSLTALLRSDASYEKVELSGGRWITINGARVYIRKGVIIAGGGGMIPAKYANPSGANIFKCQRWTSYNCMVAHKKHESDYGDAHDYRRRALELLQKPCGGNIMGYARADRRTIIRYDSEANDYAIGKVGDGGGIITMYKPTLGKRYFEIHRQDDLADGAIEK